MRALSAAALYVFGGGPIRQVAFRTRQKPWVTGKVVQETGHFYAAFLVAAMMALSAAALYVFGVGPIRQVAFRTRQKPAPV
jgi:hypothetical protein